MNQPNPNLFVAFFVAWAALAVVGSAFFWGSRNARLKRAVFPWYVGLAGFALTLFVFVMSKDPWVLLVFAPLVALITFLNVRLVKFCDRCGAIFHHYTWFGRTSFCSHCGAPVGEASNASDEAT